MKNLENVQSTDQRKADHLAMVKFTQSLKDSRCLSKAEF